MEQLIARLYESALDPGPMDSFLELYADHMGANSGVVIVFSDLKRGGGEVLGSARTDLEFQAKYAHHYGKLNVYVERLKRLPCRGHVRNGEELVAERDLVRTEYYNDYMKPQRVHHSIGTAVDLGEGVHLHLGAVRSKDKTNFGAREQAIAEALAPHFAQAVRLRQRLLRNSRRARAMSEIVDALPFGILFLSAKGRVLETNRRGAEILRTRDGLEMSGGELRAGSTSESMRLAGLVASALSIARREGVDAGGAMRLRRPSGARDYIVNVAPAVFPRGAFPGDEPVAAVAVVTDPQDAQGSGMDRLREIYRLTPSELRLCVELAGGESLSEAAAKLGVSIGTARTHLKRIFIKTDTSRQAELMRLMLTAVPLAGLHREGQ